MLRAPCQVARRLSKPLFASLIAILTACILLYLELRRFGNYPYWDTPLVSVMVAPDVVERLRV